MCAITQTQAEARTGFYEKTGMKCSNRTDPAKHLSRAYGFKRRNIFRKVWASGIPCLPGGNGAAEHRLDGVPGGLYDCFKIRSLDCAGVRLTLHNARRRVALPGAFCVVIGLLQTNVSRETFFKRGNGPPLGTPAEGQAHV